MLSFKPLKSFLGLRQQSLPYDGAIGVQKHFLLKQIPKRQVQKIAQTRKKYLKTLEYYSICVCSPIFQSRFSQSDNLAG